MVKVKASTADLLSVVQAAARLKTTRQNIYDAITRGRLKPIKIGTMILLERTALDVYGRSRQRTGRPSKKKTT